MTNIKHVNVLVLLNYSKGNRIYIFGPFGYIWKYINLRE